MKAKTLVIAGLVLFLFVQHAYADGGFFMKKDTVYVDPDLPTQRAVVFFDNGVERLIVQSEYSGILDNFAWVVPIPSLVTQDNVTVADAGIFTTLNDGTHPKIIFVYTDANEYFSLGCGAASGSRSDATDGIMFWYTLSAGPYEIAVVSSDNSAALADWLDGNGYKMPAGSDNAIDFYVSKNWYFLAIKVAPSANMIGSSWTYGLGLVPLDITFQSDNAVYPMVLTSVSAPEWTYVTLYLVSQHRMEPANVGLQEFFVLDNYPYYYYSYCIEQLENNSFILEYAGSAGEMLSGIGVPPDMFVTRLTIITDAAHMNDDYFFVESAADAPFKYKKRFFVSSYGGARRFQEPLPRSSAPWRGLAFAFGIFLAAIFILKRRMNRPAVSTPAGIMIK
jgi:hypothetical protein